MRDEFSPTIKRALAERVAFHCSNPKCRAETIGPQVDESKSFNVGTASHITAAASGGPRYDASLTEAERKHPNNAIWLCRTCGTLVDADADRFPVTLLHDWKRVAEKEASESVGQARSRGGEARNISSAKIAAGQELSAAITHLRNSVYSYVVGNFDVAPNNEHRQLSEELRQFSDTVSTHSWLLGEAVTRAAVNICDFCWKTVADIDMGNSHRSYHNNHINLQGTEIRGAAWTVFNERIPQLRRVLDEALTVLTNDLGESRQADVDRPILIVSFKGGQHRLEAIRDQRIIERQYGRFLNSTTSRWDQMSTPTRIKLYLTNFGNAVADDIEAAIDFPKECKIVPDGGGVASAIASGPQQNRLELTLNYSLLANPAKEVFLVEVLVETPNKDCLYPFTWEVHCRGMSRPATGQLELFVLPTSL